MFVEPLEHDHADPKSLIVVADDGDAAGGQVQQLALGAPLLLAGAIKGGYVAPWRWARREGIGSRPAPVTSTAATTEGDAP